MSTITTKDELEEYTDADGNIETPDGVHIDINGYLYVAGNLTVAGYLDVAGNLDVCGDLDVGGELYARRNLYVRGDISVGDYMTVCGYLTVFGNLTVGRDMTVERTLDVDGNLSCEGYLYWQLAHIPRIGGNIKAWTVPPTYQREHFAERLGITLDGCYEEILTSQTPEWWAAEAVNERYNSTERWMLASWAERATA